MVVLSEALDQESYIPDEPTMSNAEFRWLSNLAYQYSGIVINESKRHMLYGRVMKRIRRLQLTSFDDYCCLLKTDFDKEKSEFINAMTTNLTAFFRESYHFEFLKNVGFEQFKLNNSDRKIRIWSAGCSTGQEAYSIAMSIKKKSQYWDTKILATDLDSDVLQQAEKGNYNDPSGIPADYLARYSQLSNHHGMSSYDMNDDIKELICFKQLNLLHQWPMKGQFDAIFCRNVLIYFNEDTKKQLIDRFYSLLKPGGYLFIGHSESLQNFDTNLKLLGRTIYQRQ